MKPNPKLLISILAVIIFFKGLDMAVEKYFPYTEWYMYLIVGVILAIAFKTKILR